MATGAEGLLRCVFAGAIAGSDMGIRRRPYHKNCGCALHDDGRGCSKSPSARNKISYPYRGSWSGSCLDLMGSHRSSAPPLASSFGAATESQLTHRRKRNQSLIWNHMLSPERNWSNCLWFDLIHDFIWLSCINHVISIWSCLLILEQNKLTSW